MTSRIIFAAGLAATMLQSALGQEAPILRRIAPEKFPAYGGAAGSGPPVVIVPATDELPYGACDQNLPTRERTRCLRNTSELMDETATTTSKDVVRGLGQQSGVSQGQRLFVERTLGEAQELWRKTRDLECGPLAGFDKSLPGDLYERRLRCLIRADRERIVALKRRMEVESPRGSPSE